MGMWLVGENVRFAVAGRVVGGTARNIFLVLLNYLVRRQSMRGRRRRGGTIIKSSGIDGVNGNARAEGVGESIEIDTPQVHLIELE